MFKKETTIFVAHDGAYVTIGRGNDAQLLDETLKAIENQKMRGFLAVLSGSYHSKARPSVTMLRMIGDIDAEGCNEALDNFYARRNNRS